jgi:hypothetical protein
MKQFNEEKARWLNEMIDGWRSEKLISEEQSMQMKQSFTVRKFDWKQVTLYAFIIAVSCCVLSIIVLLADKSLIELLEKFTRINDFGVSLILTAITLLIFLFTQKRIKRRPASSLSNNSLLLVAAFFSLASISYWAKAIHVFHHNYSPIFLLAGAVYFIAAVHFHSKTLWVLGLQMLAVAFGAMTYFSGNGEMKFLGMNFALRYIPFSMILAVAGLWIHKSRLTSEFTKAHFFTVLLIFYTALWILTIFGNYNSYERWTQVRQTEFIVWDLLLFGVAGLGMYIGLKKYNFLVGNISLIFFILNLLTRYFEYFWKPLHKSVFFMVLAIIFWLIGSRAERLWNLKFLEEKDPV